MLKRLSFLLIAALSIPSSLNAEEYLCTPKFEGGSEKKILLRRITGFSHLKDFHKGKIDNFNKSDLLIKRDYFLREDWAKSPEGDSILINKIELKIIEEDPYDLVLGEWVYDQSKRGLARREGGYQITVIKKFGDFKYGWKGKQPVKYDTIHYFTGTIPDPFFYDDHLQFPQQKGLCILKDKFSKKDLSSISNETKLALLSFQVNKLEGGFE